jgi:DNA-binding transcriptional MerR regulator
MSLRTPQVASELNLSYRVLDYWIRQKAVFLADPGYGSGSARYFSNEEVYRLRFISRFYHLIPQLFSIDFVRQCWDRSTSMKEYDTHYEMELQSGIVLTIPKEN